MKITSTFKAILMVCAMLAFNTCDDTGKNKTLIVPVNNGGGQTYAIGETGPSGVGIVFYVTDGGLHGLEAAPSLWDGGSADPICIWINGTYQAASIGTTSIAIGTGWANTTFIIDEPGESPSAAQLCRAYQGGEKSDWFLPSL